jgi:hypothetical protein
MKLKTKPGPKGADPDPKLIKGDAWGETERYRAFDGKESMKGNGLERIFRNLGIASLCFLGLDALILGVDQIIKSCPLLHRLSLPGWEVIFVYNGVLGILFGTAVLFLALWFKKGEVKPSRLGLVVALYSIRIMKIQPRGGSPNWLMTFVMTALAIVAIVLYIRPSFPARLAGSISGLSVVFLAFVLTMIRFIEARGLFFHPIVMMTIAYWTAILLGCIAAIHHALPGRSTRITLLTLCAAAMVYGVMHFSSALYDLWFLPRWLPFITLTNLEISNLVISAVSGFFILTWSTVGFVIYRKGRF